MSYLVAGSYERFLFGYSVKSTNGDAAKGFSLDKGFSYPAHKGPVKCVAGAFPFVASGGADDTVHIYNAQKGIDLGPLMSPGDGAVTALAFFTPAGTPTPTHLLSGAADGSIAVWASSGGWDCLKVLKGHKKEVTSLSVHPSGLLALSTARDDMLRMWNMTKGRSQYKTKIPPGTDCVSFSPDGDAYVLLSGSKVSAHEVCGEDTIGATYELKDNGLCMTFLSSQVIAIGGDRGKLSMLDLRSKKIEQTVQAHSARIRGVAALASSSGQPADAGGSAVTLGTASTDGCIRLWDLRHAGQSEPLCEASTSARLTCLCTVEETVAAGQRQPKQAWQISAAAAAAASEEQPEKKSQPRKSRRDDQVQAMDCGQSPSGVASKKQEKGATQQKERGEAQKKKGVEAAEGVVVRRPGESEFVVEFPADMSQPKKKKGKKKS